MKAHYEALRAFLRPYQSIWQDSILQNWPASRSSFQEAWFDELSGLSSEGLRDFANLILRKDPTSKGETLPPFWASLISEAEAFENPLPPSTEKLSVIDSQGLNRKKQYEIEQILPLLAQENEDGLIKRAVDIGGGMGHLARLCIKNFDWDFHTIDRDEALQEKGRFWLKRTRNFPREKLHFVHGHCTAEDKSFDPYFSAPHTLSLGLHTCGSLAVTQFQMSRGSKVIFNFGCCYDKTEAKDLNLSEASRNDPIPWNQSSLFLATRSRKELNEKDFDLMRRVNDYRFALDIYFREHWADKGFIVAGDAPKALYSKSFEDYAEDRMAKLEMGTGNRDELKRFFERPKTQEDIKTIFLAHLIRNVFARPLERCLIYDRALWLEELGYRVEVKDVFDRAISPRNLLIIARR